MGTDATALVEIQDADGTWKPVVKPIWPNPGWQDRNERPFAGSPHISRHYALFSVLADVRNRTGRGTQTMAYAHNAETGELIRDDSGEPMKVPYDTDDGGHDPLEYIDVPRGVPDDAFEAWKGFVEAHPGTHDPTWFTLNELDKDLPIWDQVIYEQCVMTEEEYAAFRDEGKRPKYFARGVGGDGSRTVNEVEFAAGIRGEKMTGIDVRFKGRTVRDDVGSAWWATLAVMHLVAPDGDNTRVRILIVFDS